MKHLKPQTIESAPEAAKESLKAIQKGYGFIPNLLGTFANAPAVLNSYIALDSAWGHSSLSPKERQFVLLATSVQNHCNYCKSAHSTALKHGLKVDADLVQAVRENRPLKDAKLNALVKFTKELVSERGFVSENTKAEFLSQGYNETQMLEVVVGVGMKTISNYIDHLNPVEIDAGFKAEA